MGGHMVFCVSCGIELPDYKAALEHIIIVHGNESDSGEKPVAYGVDFKPFRMNMPVHEPQDFEPIKSEETDFDSY